jgi:predicted nucleic acid-binding protein
MTQPKPSVYFDTCCFVDIAQTDLGFKADGAPTHIEACRVFLKAARAGDCKIYTSLITMTEFVCVKGNAVSLTDPKRERILDDSVKASIRRLLLAGNPVVPIQPTLRVTEFARDLCWDYDMQLSSSGADRIHVASARFVGCGYFVTTDTQILKHAEMLFKTCSLRVVTCDTIKDVLPDSYFPRQGSLLDEANRPKKQATASAIVEPNSDGSSAKADAVQPAATAPIEPASHATIANTKTSAAEKAPSETTPAK